MISLQERFATDLEGASAALSEALLDPVLRQGLALASPDFCRAISKAGLDDWRPKAGVARTAIGYLARAAVKTSPFSTLTLLDVSLRGLQQPEGGAARSLQLARSVLTHLWMNLASHPDLSRAMTYRVNESLHQQGEQWSVLAANYLYTGEFAWRTERVGDVTALRAMVSRFVPGEVLTYAQVRERLAPGDHAAVERVIQASVLLPVFPMTEQDDPLQALIAWLDQTEVGAPLARILSRIEETFGHLETVGGEERPWSPPFGQSLLRHSVYWGEKPPSGQTGRPWSTKMSVRLRALASCPLWWRRILQSCAPGFALASSCLTCTMPS